MKVTLLLADFAEVINGKLYIMGGGWSITGPQPAPFAIAAKIEVPWTGANEKHTLRLDLLDGDFKPIQLPTPAGKIPLSVGGDFEVGRPLGMLPGTPLDLPFAFNMGPIPLAPGRRYVWKLAIDGKSQDDWQVGFSTRSSPQLASAK